MKYVRVMDGLTSNAGGFEYKLDEVNVASNWNPSTMDPSLMGGFNFSNEESIIRWTIRGTTLYDVEIPEDAEIIKCDSKNTPNGVFRSNKIIVSNPRVIDNELMMELYLKSNLPINTYFQCLCFLSLKDYEEVCMKIIEDRVNEENINQAIETFTTFIEIEDDSKYEIYRKVKNRLNEIKK